jgi:osmoprotectant transport system substrate-binding protein
VVDKTGLGDPWVVRAALVAGNVDLAWDYTGTIWTTYLRHDRPIGNAEELFQRVREEDALNQIAWVANAPCQRALTLFMREAAAKELKIAAFKDLARTLNRVRPDLRLCVPEKQYQSASGISGLERFYGFRFDPRLVRFLPLEEGYQALERGECECALGYANDLAAKTKNLRALQDDLGYWQASSLAVGVRAGVLQESPELEPLLLRLSQRLTQQAVLDLHYQVAVEGKKPEAVAKAFLAQ